MTTTNKKLTLAEIQDKFRSIADEHRDIVFREGDYLKVKSWHDKIHAAMKEHLSENEGIEFQKVCDKWVIGPELNAMLPAHFNNFKREALIYLDKRIDRLKDGDLA